MLEFLVGVLVGATVGMFFMAIVIGGQKDKEKEQKQ